MKKKAVSIRLKEGLEARPVAVLVQLASQFDCSVYLQTGGKKVNAKSIMGMMSLGLDNGEELQVICDGSDEDAALGRIENYLLGKS